MSKSKHSRRSWLDSERQHSAEQVKRQVSIADVLQHYGGRIYSHGTDGWRAVRCPFHNDRHASASVNIPKGLFHCHVCDFGGDIFDLVGKHEGTDFARSKAYIERNLM